MENNIISLKRKEKDVAKLLLSQYDVLITDQENRNQIYVILNGPKDSPYENVSYFNFNLLGMLENFSNYA